MSAKLPQNILGVWLDRTGISRDDFAEKLRMKRENLDRLTRGARNPGLDLAFHIQEATGDAIKVEEWRQLPSLAEIEEVEGKWVNEKPKRSPKARSRTTKSKTRTRKR